MAQKKNDDMDQKIKTHFEAVKDFFKKKNKDVHVPRKLRKEIARKKTLENKGNNE